jgi:imidazolonepropionase-like amidohydrolase
MTIVYVSYTNWKSYFGTAPYLASGVTAVLDLGGPFWTFEARERSKRMPHAPELAVVGPLISSHMSPELRVADPPILKVRAPDEARVAVRRVLAERPDLIKLWWIPEASRALAEQTEWVRAAIEEAHRAGVCVAVHAPELEVARAAVRAGAHVLVHSVDDRRVDDAFVRLLKERYVVYVTTLGVNQGYREVFEQRFKPTDLELQVGDAEVLATLDDLADISRWKGAFWKRWFLRWPDPRIAFWNLRRLHEAGITVAAGSDAGNIGTLHGPALHRELERMAEAGLAPLAILQAATQGGARAMGRVSDLGAVEPGKRADLLVLDADPERDIRNTRRIHRVIRGGIILNPDEIIKATSRQPLQSEAGRHGSY